MPWPSKNKPASILLSRFARNVYFWLFMLGTKILGTQTGIPPRLYYPLIFFNISFFILPCTLNNYVLIPRLLRRQNYLWYIALFWCMVYAFALTYTLWLKFLTVAYPGIEIFDVSITDPGIDSDFSYEAVLSQMHNVFYILLMITFGFTGVWYINDHARNEKLVQVAVKKQLETELNFLRSQVNPHFLFNTLNNLYGLALQRSDEAPGAILKLSSILRYILYESNTGLISFEKEKEIMQAYIDIEMLRLSEHDNARFSISSDRPRNIPPLLWLPVLENVFKHGAATLEEDYRIDFRFAIHGNTLSIYSKNTCRPAGQKSSGAKAGGIGLANLRKRLQILYPGKHSIVAGPGSDNLYTVNVQITWHE